MSNAIAINASNLHSGGGVQVATSFIDELSRIDFKDLNIHIFASKEVNDNLISIGTNLDIFKNYNVINIHGLEALKPSITGVFKNFKIVFTIFGPSYLLFLKGRQIVGFAQAWICYPNNEVYKKISITMKYKLRVKYFFQKLFFSNAHTMIVELDHVKSALS